MGTPRKTIMIVDDEPTNIRLFKAVLAPLGVTFITTDNGRDGIEMARKNRPDLLLLDVMMAGMDGFEVCRRLKDDPVTARIPVIMVTGYSEETTRKKGRAAGACSVISKPFENDDLRSEVRRALDQGLRNGDHEELSIPH